MGKRLSESTKLIERAYRKKMKKQKWQKTIPSFKNLNIDASEAFYFKQIQIVITNLLDVDEKARFSRIHEIKPAGATYIITSVVCPFCKKPAYINFYWNSFMCFDEEHDKKIYEITRVVVDNAVPKAFK